MPLPAAGPGARRDGLRRGCGGRRTGGPGLTLVSSESVPGQPGLSWRAGGDRGH